jgi:hypothetical protein
LPDEARAKAMVSEAELADQLEQGKRPRGKREKLLRVSLAISSYPPLLKALVADNGLLEYDVLRFLRLKHSYWQNKYGSQSAGQTP